MVLINEAREILADDKSLTSFDDIVYQRVLGASKHINMIGEMIESIALNGRNKSLSADKVIDDILILSNFFIQNRGEESQAVSNAINIMTKGLDKARDLDIEEAVKIIIQNKNRYINKAQDDLNKVVEYSVKVASSMEKILVFDYSSTVNTFIESLRESNKNLTIIIPESRVIDGGHGFVETSLEAGHNVHFIPDSAIMYYLEQCDGAFFGAETLLPDGTAYNTIGSDIVGLVCKEFGIPLYVLSPLIKIDVRSLYGHKKELKINDMEEKLASNWEESEKENTVFKCPELIGVKPKYITAIITEQGIIPANQFFEVSTNFHDNLKGD